MKIIPTLVAAVASACLVACGGGGGSTPPVAPTPPATPTPVVSAATLVTSVPAANYTGDSAATFALLNTERSNCGFGLLAQNAKLDGSAAAHALYMVANNVGLHTEVPGQPGFTGVNPVDRTTAAGYPGNASSVSEGIALGSGTTAIRNLLGAPYHLNTLIRSYRDVGMAFKPTSIPNNPEFVLDIGYQTAAGPQLLASTDVKTYPCDGTTGVNYQLRGETPSPVPGRDLAANPIGTPISIKVRDGNVLVITNAAMIKVSTGAGVALRTPVGASNDPNAVNGLSYFSSNEAYIAPDAPLSPGSQYQATITGTNNGVAFSRTFSFTTGTGFN